MFSSQPQPRPQPQPDPRHGFALVIALGLMAFVLLLILSMSTLVRVESESSSVSLKQLEARQNAMLGAMVGLGELQKYAGADQRATATGERVGAGDGVRHWTGVWGNRANPQNALAEDASALHWLVSGNEASEFSPAANVDRTEAAFGQITGSFAAPTYEAGSAAAVFDYAAPEAATVDGAAAVLLVGDGSVEDSDATAAVAAPLVPIESGSAGSAQYAWWVGDESVKARVDLVDPFVEPTAAMKTAGYPAVADSLARVAVPQRVAAETLSGLDGLPGLPANSPDWRRVDALPTLPLLAGISDPDLPKQLFHRATTTARGVLADTARGGLKRDLTYLAARSQDSFIDALIPSTEQASDFNPIIGEAILPKAAGGPTWEQVHSFLNLRYDGATPLPGRAQTATTHGFAPVVTVAKLFAGGTRNASGNFVFYIFPSFTLANPYDAAIAAGDFTVRISVVSGSAKLEALQASDPSPDDEALLAPSPFWEDDFADVFDDMTFTLRLSQPLAAGEARVFTLDGDDLDGNAELAWSSGMNVGMADEWDNGFGALAIDTGVALAEEDLIDDPDVDDSTDKVGVLARIQGGNTEIQVDFGDSAGNIVQRVQGLRLAGSPGNRTKDKYLIQSELETSLVLPSPGVEGRRIQGGFFLKLVDPGHARPDTTNYNGVSNVRRAMHSQYNWRSPYIDALAHYTDNGANGPDPFVAFGHNTWDGFTLRYGSDLLLNPLMSGDSRIQWAGVLDVRQPDGAFGQFLWAPFHTLRGDLEPASVGEFRNFNPGGHPEGGYDANNAPLYVTPAQSIGVSRAHPLIARDEVSATLAGQTYYDLSYLLNRELLDPFFFSTYPQDVGVPGDSDMRLVNARLRPADGGVDLSDDTEFRESGAGGGNYTAGDERRAAEHLLLDGAFNVNATSVEAWEALLASLRGVDFKGSDSWNAPLPGSITPLEGEADATDMEASANWNGFRDLTDDQLADLAEAIVDGVKARGPFLSVADFMNRELAAGAEGRNGILADAIRTAGLNASFPSMVPTWGPAPELSSEPNDLPGGLFEDDEHLPENQLQDIAGWLSEADLLQVLAPVITARGDTFRIRSYGDVRDPVSGDVVSRVWCELLVQRTPDYVGAGDAATLDPFATSESSQVFGRRFEIVDFRWLSEEDV